MGVSFSPAMAGRENDGITEVPIAGIHFRDYRDDDGPALARLAREAWPARPGVRSSEEELSSMRGYVEYTLGASNWAQVACTPEGVVGFLFGRIDGFSGRPMPGRSFLGEIPATIRWFLGRGKRVPWHLSFMWGIVLTELKLALRTPDSDASIEMFIVDSRHRGKGIGGQLMDRFLHEATAAGASLVTVYTDDRQSDWRYYERRGFRRTATFHDNITSRYSGLDAKGIIYALDLRRG